MTAFDPHLAARIASSGIPLSADLVQDAALSAAEDAAMQALSVQGAMCGDCGDEPGDRNCPDCERCRRWYVAALRKAGWAPRTEVLGEAEEIVRRSAAGWQQIETPNRPDHFKVIAAHALLIAEAIRRASEAGGLR